MCSEKKHPCFQKNIYALDASNFNPLQKNDEILCAFFPCKEEKIYIFKFNRFKKLPEKTIRFPRLGSSYQRFVV